MILTKILKSAMLYLVLDWQKGYKTVLEKAFFFILLVLLTFLVLVSTNLENDPLEK